MSDVQMTEADRKAANQLCRMIMTSAETFALEESAISKHFAAHAARAVEAVVEMENKTIADQVSRIAELHQECERLKAMLRSAVETHEGDVKAAVEAERKRCVEIIRSSRHAASGRVLSQLADQMQKGAG